MLTRLIACRQFRSFRHSATAWSWNQAVTATAWSWNQAVAVRIAQV